MNKLSSQDRSALIRLASTMPAGSEERKAILAGLSGTDKTSHFTDKQIESLKNKMTGKTASDGNAKRIILREMRLGRGYYESEFLDWLGEEWQGRPLATLLQDMASMGIIEGSHSEGWRRSSDDPKTARFHEGPKDEMQKQGGARDAKTAGYDYNKPIEGKMDYSDMKAEYRRFALSKARLLGEAHNRQNSDDPENQVEVDSLFIAGSTPWSGGVSFDIQDGNYTMDITLTFGKFTANFT